MYHIMLGVIIAGVISAFVGICVVAQQERVKIKDITACYRMYVSCFCRICYELTAQSLAAGGNQSGIHGKMLCELFYILYF